MKDLLVPTPGAILCAALLVGLTGVTWHASRAGWGVPEPVPEPPSIREGSVGGPVRAGRYRTRYFRGGGIHHGK